MLSRAEGRRSGFFFPVQGVVMQHTITIGRKSVRRLGRVQELTHTITYRLGPKPYRLYQRHELPSSHEFEDHEAEDAVYIKRGCYFFNLSDFLTIGMPRLPGPHGGAQLAAGEFLIAAFDGEVYPVHTDELKTHGYDDN